MTTRMQTNENSTRRFFVHLGLDSNLVAVLQTASYSPKLTVRTFDVAVASPLRSPSLPPKLTVARNS